MLVLGPPNAITDQHLWRNESHDGKEKKYTSGWKLEPTMQYGVIIYLERRVGEVE